MIDKAGAKKKVVTTRSRKCDDEGTKCDDEPVLQTHLKDNSFGSSFFFFFCASGAKYVFYLLTREEFQAGSV